MKLRINALFILLIASLSVSAQQKSGAAIRFREEVHDFDTVARGTRNCRCVFYFINTGTAPLIISDVRSSCGCTVAEWSKRPVLPGKSGTIYVAYNTSRRGSFVKTVLVKSNAVGKPKRVLQIKGFVK